MRTTGKRVAAAAFLLCWPIALEAAPSEPTQIECDYSSYSDPDGNHRVEKRFSFVFLVTPDGKSYLIGNNGASEVQMVEGMDRRTFIEVTLNGHVATTTIAKDGTSVHSRQPVIGGRLQPSQYYGRCT